jgi:hypothetical protein
MVSGNLGCGSTVLAAMAILAPSRAASRAVARPIPRLPPVMKIRSPYNDGSAPAMSTSDGLRCSVQQQWLATVSSRFSGLDPDIFFLMTYQASFALNLMKK